MKQGRQFITAHSNMGERGNLQIHATEGRQSKQFSWPSICVTSTKGLETPQNLTNLLQAAVSLFLARCSKTYLILSGFQVITMCAVKPLPYTVMLFAAGLGGCSHCLFVRKKGFCLQWGSSHETKASKMPVMCNTALRLLSISSFKFLPPIQ